MNSVTKVVPVKIIVFLIVAVLGLSSSVITAIIAALLLVELMNCMPFDRQTKINLIIIACFSIGLGAVLTPVGEPLSTIAITKLQGEPYNAGFFFLFNQLAIYIIPGCLAMGLLAMFFTGKAKAMECKVTEEDDGGLRDVVIRALKVYVFVMALLLLGGGMKVVIDKYILGISPEILYSGQHDLCHIGQRNINGSRDKPENGPCSNTGNSNGPLNRRWYADPRKYLQHHLRRKAGHLQKGMGQARSSFGASANGDILRMGILHTFPH